MVEFDGEAEAKTVVGLEAGDLVAVADFHSLQDADEAFRRVLLDDTCGLQQEHERAGRTVHDRHFRRGELDVGVIHAQTGQCGHQVLDGHRLAAVMGQAGAEHGFGDVIGAGGDLGHRVQINAAEHDTGIDRGRTHSQIDLLAAVQAHAGGADHVLQGALLGHGGSCAGKDAGCRKARKCSGFGHCGGRD